MSVPDWANVVLLVRFNDLGTTITDESATPASIINIKPSSVVSTDFKFGGASAEMASPSRGFRINLPDAARFRFTGSYTIEGWFKAASFASSPCMFGITDSAGFAQWTLRVNSSNKLTFLSRYQSSVTSTLDVPLNDWFHVAAVRTGTSGGLRIYVNGTLYISCGDSGSYAAAGACDRFEIGEYFGNQPWVGFVDEVRVTSGEAVYTADFSPPTAEFAGAPTGPVRPLRKTQYLPGTQGVDLVRFIRNEFERVNNATESGWTHELLDKLTQEPTRKRVGMKVYADGSLWNPGSGEGIYVLTSSGWQKLG